MKRAPLWVGLLGTLGIVGVACARGVDNDPFATDTPEAGLDGDVTDDSSIPQPDGSTGPSADSSAATRDAPAGDDDASSGDVASGEDATSVDAMSTDAAVSDAIALHDVTTGTDASSANIAPSGTGYTWQSMTSSTASTGKKAATAVNDGNTSTQVDIDSSSGDNANAWEAAGVVFSSGRTIASVSFVQGKTASTDGWFEAKFGLQFSSDGATWTDSGWTAAPSYAYSSAVSDKTYAFSGAQVSGIQGVRVVGQVNTPGGMSWWAAVSEIEVYGF